MTSSRYRLIFSSIVLGGAILYAFLNPQYRMGSFNDDSVYSIAARDLWNRSTPDIFPQISPDYPLPGVPLMLAPLTKWANPFWSRLEWMSVAATIVTIILFGFLSRKFLSPTQTLIATALFAFNPAVARFSGVVMPAAYYTLAVTAGFLLLISWAEKPNWSKALALGFILGWGSLIRPEGLLLLISVAGIIFFYYRTKKHVQVMFLPLIMWAIFFGIWIHTRQSKHVEYAREWIDLFDYWLKNFFAGLAFLSEIGRVFINTLSGHTFRTETLWSWAGLITGGVTLGTITTGVAQSWKEQVNNRPIFIGIGVFIFLYLTVYFFWHIAIPRYFVPIIPLTIIFMVKGLEYFPFGISKSRLNYLLLLFLVATYIPQNLTALSETTIAPDPMKRPPYATLAWINNNTHADARFYSIIAPTIALYTYRYATSKGQANSVEEFQYSLLSRNMTYIVDRKVNALAQGVGKVDDWNKAAQQIRTWVKLYPGKFPVVYKNRNERTKIFKVENDVELVKAFAKYRVASRFYAEGNFEKALREASAAYALDPDMGCNINLLGVLHMLNNDVDAADQYLTMAHQIKPTSQIFLLNLATLNKIRGNQEKALEFINQGYQTSISLGQEERFNRYFDYFQKAWGNDGSVLFIDTPSDSAS